MSEKKIEIPAGMLKAAYEWCPASFAMPAVKSMLEAALRWLSDNPITPTDEQLNEMKNDLRFRMIDFDIQKLCAEWQRRMFLALELVPEAVKDLLCGASDIDKEAYFRPDIYNKRIIEAFNRGRRMQ